MRLPSGLSGPWADGSYTCPDAAGCKRTLRIRAEVEAEFARVVPHGWTQVTLAADLEHTDTLNRQREWWAAKGATSNAGRRKKLAGRTCAQCKGPIHTAPQARYCSRACKRAAENARSAVAAATRRAA